MIAALVSDLWPYLATAGVALLAYFGVLAKGKRIANNKRTADRLKAMQKKSQIEKDVSNADRDSVIDSNTRP